MTVENSQYTLPIHQLLNCTIAIPIYFRNIIIRNYLNSSMSFTYFRSGFAVSFLKSYSARRGYSSSIHLKQGMSF